MGQLNYIYQLKAQLEQISSQVKYEENDNNYKMIFTSSIDKFKSILTAPFIQKVISKHDFLRINFRVDKSIHPLQDFERFKFPNNTCELHLTILKKHIQSLPISYDIYFDIDLLCDNILENKTNIFNDTDEKKVLFLPVDKVYQNHYLYILSLEKLESFTKEELNLTLAEHTKKQKIMLRDLFPNKKIENPYIYYIENLKKIKNLYDAMNFKLFLNTFKLLANKTEDNYLFFYGERNLKLISNYFVVKNPEPVLELLRFNLDREKFNDKIIITRNVITIYIVEEDNFEKIDQMIKNILNTVELHFRAYIKKQLDHFFDRRKEVVDEAYNAAKDSSNQSDKIISSINVTIIGLLSAILTGFLTYSTGSKAFMVLVMLSHLFYFILIATINIRNGTRNKKEIENQFHDYSNEFSVLDEEQILEIKKKFLTPALSRLYNVINLFKVLSVVISITFLIILLYIIFVYNPTAQDSQLILSIKEIIINIFE